MWTTGRMVLPVAARAACTRDIRTRSLGGANAITRHLTVCEMRDFSLHFKLALRLLRSLTPAPSVRIPIPFLLRLQGPNGLLII